MDRMVYQKKKTFHLFRALFLLIIVGLVALCIYEYKRYGNLNNIAQTFSNINFSNINFSKINISEQSFSSQKNLIEGQTLIEDADGYTTTFTTLNAENQKTYIEYKQNQEASWSDEPYWGGTMSENGCGITSMAIVASGYGLKVTPEDLREDYYPHLDGEDMAKELRKLGFKCTDFYFHGSYISKAYIMDWLRTNRPIIICVDNKKANKWTTASHYMVLLDINENGLVYLSNPNGKDGTEKASGWYSLKDILPYIVKALFIESY